MMLFMFLLALEANFLMWLASYIANMIHSDGETHFEVSSGYIQVFQGESKTQKELCVVDINIYNMLTTQALLGNYSFTGRSSYI